MGQDATEVRCEEIRNPDPMRITREYVITFRVVYWHEVRILLKFPNEFVVYTKSELFVDSKKKRTFKRFRGSDDPYVSESFKLDGTKCVFEHTEYQSRPAHWYDPPNFHESMHLYVNKKEIWSYSDGDVSPASSPAPQRQASMAAAPPPPVLPVSASPPAPPSQPSGGTPPQKKQKPPEEQKPYPVPTNRYDLVRLDQLYGGAASPFIAALFLLCGVGGLVGVWTQAWVLALAAVGIGLVLSYILGYRKVFSPLTLGIIAVLSGAVVVAATSSVSAVSYDQTYTTHFLFGIERMLTIRHQLIAGTGVGAIASLWGLAVFRSKRANGDGMGLGLTVGILYGLIGGGILWLVALVLGSIFDWGFGFGAGWLNSLLDGFLVTVIACLGLISLLYVWRKTQKTWGWRDAARWRLEERFGGQMEAGLLEELSKADEIKIKELLPQIEKGTPAELLDKLRS